MIAWWRMCASVGWVIIGSDMGLSPVRWLAITLIIDDIISIPLSEIYFSEMSIEILTDSFKKMHLNISSAKKISHVILVSICYQMCSYSITTLDDAQRFAVLLSCIFDSQISSFSLIDESMTRKLKIMCVKNILIYTHISYGEGEEQRCIWINGITT